MKRSRESTGVDVALIEIYEDLAHHEEEVRLKAAYSLLTQHTPKADEAQTVTILSRLFRGLCSSRKAARLGFAIALSETLRQLDGQPERTISSSQIIDILEKQTRTEGNTSGQDERDHYFGRIFGSEAVVQSGILFRSQDLPQWHRLLDIICIVAQKKPWLRQTCGWILFTSIKGTLSGSEQANFVSSVLQKLNEHKLIRTPEGLAIWIEARRHHPGLKFPKHVWKHNDPLSMKDLQLLSDVMKDAKAGSKGEDEPEVQGSAMWAANLHFIWDVVLSELLLETGHGDAKRIEAVQRFWQTAVDKALFAPINSHERKHWGFLVLCKALQKSPRGLISVVFSENAVSCLMQSLKSPDRHLQKSALRVTQTLQECVVKRPLDAQVYIICLLRASDMVDFDVATKTKTMDGLLAACNVEASLGLALSLNHDLFQPSNGAQNINKRRTILNYEAKIISHQVNQALDNGGFANLSVIHAVLDTWVALTFGNTHLNEAETKSVREKIQNAFEQLLKLGQEGIKVVTDVVHKLRASFVAETISEDSHIVETIEAGWIRFGQLHGLLQKKTNGVVQQSNAETPSKGKPAATKKSEGLTLLYGLILFEICAGDTDAVQILQELLDSEADSLGNRKADVPAVSEIADTLLDILLSFASKPSKFLRRITLVIFETLTSQISRNGLQSLTNVLEARETKAGQQELFEANGDVDMLENGDDEDSDVEMLDSDVEVVSASGSESGSSESDSASDSESSDDDEASDEEDEETDVKQADLLALETSLAAALGTRKLTEAGMDTSSSNSESDDDSDMTDSEMLALDEKLAEVFRNRAATSNKSKKQEHHSAKETVINFKNRVLDMLEVYVRREHLNPRSLDLIIPLFQLARKTNTKQIADRTIKVLTMYFKRCGGLDRVPSLPRLEATKAKSKSKKDKHKKIATLDKPEETLQSNDTLTVPEALELLNQIHAEFLLPNTSNAHRQACSKASIVMAKTVLKAGVRLKEVEGVYAATKTKLKDIEDGHGLLKAQEAFFDDWANWKRSVEGRVGV